MIQSRNKLFQYTRNFIPKILFFKVIKSLSRLKISCIPKKVLSNLSYLRAIIQIIRPPEIWSDADKGITRRHRGCNYYNIRDHANEVGVVR